MKPRAITVQQIAEARVLRSDLGWTFDRIAKILGVAEGTVRYQLSQGKQIEIRELAKRMHRSAINSVKSGRVQKMTRDFTAKAIERRLLQQGRCAMTGRLFEYVSGSDWMPSCDRLDHTGPYSMRNTQFVGKAVNLARQSRSVPEFVEFCKDIVSHTKFPEISREEIEAFQNAT